MQSPNALRPLAPCLNRVATGLVGSRYSLLHLAGYDSVAMDDLKQFRLSCWMLSGSCVCLGCSGCTGESRRSEVPAESKRKLIRFQVVFKAAFLGPF